MAIFTAIMAGAVWLTTTGLSFFLDSTNRWQAIIIIIIGVAIGAIFYFALALKSKLAHRLFGSKIERLKNKLGV